MSIHASFSTYLKFLFLFVLSFGSVGCGNNNGQTGSDAGVSFTEPLVERSWTLPAGLETYKCKGLVAVQDLYIKGFRAHTDPALARMTVTVSDMVGTIGDYDCGPADGFFSSRMIYAAGPGVNDVHFPAGNGVVVRAGQYIHLNMHLANKYGTDSLSGTTQLLMETGTSADVTTPLDMIYIGTFNIQIPPNSTGVVMAGGCSAGIDQTYLFLSPAMNKQGTHQRVQVYHLNSPEPSTLLDENFDVTQQHIHGMRPGFKVLQGEAIRVACTYNGNSSYTIGFGDSVDLEMCFTGVYRYPVIPDTPVFGCVSF